MDPDHLAFVRSVEAGSLSAAARGMGLTPAAVSKRLARLEARLGVGLVHRTTRRLTLTEAGRRFHADLVPALAAVDAAEARAAGEHREPAGPLRLSAPTSFGRLHVVGRLAAFLERFPRVRLEIDLSDDYADLLAGRVDLAIRIAATIPASFVGHRLADNRRVLCASPAYLDRHGAPASIDDLSRHRLLAAAGQLPWHLVNGARRRRVDGESHVRTNSSEVARELAIAGAGIALRSRWDVGPALAAGALVPVLPGWEGSRDVAIHLVHPRTPAPSAAVTEAVRFLREGIDARAWGG